MVHKWMCRQRKELVYAVCFPHSGTPLSLFCVRCLQSYPSLCYHHSWIKQAWGISKDLLERSRPTPRASPSLIHSTMPLYSGIAHSRVTGCPAITTWSWGCWVKEDAWPGERERDTRNKERVTCCTWNTTRTFYVYNAVQRIMIQYSELLLCRPFHHPELQSACLTWVITNSPLKTPGRVQQGSILYWGKNLWNRCPMFPPSLFYLHTSCKLWTELAGAAQRSCTCIAIPSTPALMHFL